MLSDIYMKFHEDSLNGFQIIELTRFCEGQSSQGKNSKKYKWFLPSALCLMLIDIYLKFCGDSLRFSSYRADTIL